MACAVSAQVPETAEVAAARAAHMAAHAAARGWVMPMGAPVWLGNGQHPVDSQDVYLAKMEHFRAWNDAAAANGVRANVALNHPYYHQGWNGAYVPVETAEVAAARAAHMAAHAAARG